MTINPCEALVECLLNDPTFECMSWNLHLKFLLIGTITLGEVITCPMVIPLRVMTERLNEDEVSEGLSMKSERRVNEE